MSSFHLLINVKTLPGYAAYRMPTYWNAHAKVEKWIQPMNIWPFLTDNDHWILINRQTREFLLELQPKKLKVKPSLAFSRVHMVFSKVLFEFYVFEIIISIFELKLIIIRSTIFDKLIKNSRPRVVPFVRPWFQLNGSLFLMWLI